MAKTKHTLESLQERLFLFGKNHIEILEFNGSVDRYGKFRCLICGTEWDAIVNNVVRKDNRKKCPLCSKEEQKRKPILSAEEKIIRTKYYGSYEYKKSHPSYLIDRKKYENNRYKNDLNYRITKILRSQISRIIKKSKTLNFNGRLLKNVNYSVAEFIKYIELQFDENMNWNNYGSYWEVDHIIPISYYLKNDIIDISIINDLTNLRPLRVEENRIKGDSVDFDFYENPA